MHSPIQPMPSTCPPPDQPLLLGQPTAYPERYDPTLLCPLPRAPKRAELGVGATLPFLGADLWTAYELSLIHI